MKRSRSTRAWQILSVCFVLAALAGPAAATAGACGEAVDVGPQQSVLPGAPPLALGDSVLYDAGRPLSAQGFHVNAMVCRTMQQGIAYLAPRAASLPGLVVVALGTNGTVSRLDVGALLRILGPQRLLALVTPEGGDDPSVPTLYRALARQNASRILLLDWQAYSNGHPDWFAPDGIHLGGNAGIAAFARLVASAVSGATGSAAGGALAPATASVTSSQLSTSTARTTAKSVPRSRPAARLHPLFSGDEREQLRRIVLYVRLTVIAAVTNGLALVTE